MSERAIDHCSDENAPLVGVLGAGSVLGRRLLPRLAAGGWRVRAFSRSSATVDAGNAAAGEAAAPAGIAWRLLDRPAGPPAETIPCWVALCPLWALAERLPWLEDQGVKRLVALSSTSRFTKHSSSDPAERGLAARLASAEDKLLEWASGRGVIATLLRPTLVYDGLHDRNVALIAAFIRRWGWFPIVGSASGLRQPVHVDDVAAACVSALSAASLAPAYELSGAETLSYRDMVGRVFLALGLPARFVTVPAWAVRLALPLLRPLPRFRHLSSAMFARMDVSMAFDHAAATRDLGFQPRGFALSLVDRPRHD